MRAVRVPLDIGSILREAADTIWDLRNKCADLVGERERLFRANVEKNNEMLRLARDNGKLRELARKLYGDCTGGHYMVSCEGCEHAYEDYGGYVPLDPDYCVFSFSDRYVGCWKQKRLEAEMRELGVEVPE